MLSERLGIHEFRPAVLSAEENYDRIDLFSVCHYGKCEILPKGEEVCHNGNLEILSRWKAVCRYDNLEILPRWEDVCHYSNRVILSQVGKRKNSNFVGSAEILFKNQFGIRACLENKWKNVSNPNAGIRSFRGMERK